ncbi:hypothetical protein ACJMK2_029977 [Sinanodonta woodiana]|uniref:CUB domain-containing protein n=1 Tax=Sinanodonta woodiana TaxID=1069815 RepID=A0ABD3XE96_SINWO
MATAVSVGQTLDTRIFEQCYGSMWKNYLTASCDANQVISVISLKAFAKHRYTCPQEETAQTPLPSDSCCRHSISDCGGIYDGVSRQNLYLSCDGRQDCLGIPIAWMNTPSQCNTGEHLNRTSYMRMEYNCIPNTVIAKLIGSIVINDTEVYIQNPKYPDGNTFPPGTTMTCWVEAFPQTPIVVTAMYLKFLQVASGVCGQRVTIEDGTKAKEISCESNNNYTITDIYNSSSHIIKFSVFSNILSNRDWRFSFKFKDGQNDGNLLLIAILVPLAVILIVVIVVVILCCSGSGAQKCCYGKGAIHPLPNTGVGLDTENARLQKELEIKEREKDKEAKRKKHKRWMKKMKLKSELRFLENQERINEINRFRIAGYTARAFHPPVMRPYFPGSGQENYYIPEHNMYDQQLPPSDTIYGYPADQNLIHQNTSQAGVQLSSTSISTDGNYKNVYAPSTAFRRHPSAISFSQKASEAPLIFHTGQFRGQTVPQGSVYEPYENPALKQWRVMGTAASFASHPRTRRPTVEIGSVDNPDESESNQSYDDSIV